MILTLNNEPFDVTIENEKTLNELYSGLSQWLIESGLEITGLISDGIELKPGNRNDWGGNLLADIEKLDITAISGSDRYISDLQTLYQYISLLQSSIKGKNDSLTSDLLNELPYISSTLDSFLSKKDQPQYGTHNLLESISKFKEDNKNESNLLELLYNISQSLNTRIKEVTSPFSEIKKTAELLKELIPQISDVSVMLQTGDDEKAMDSVLNFIELSEKMIRIFPILKEFGYTDISKESLDSVSFVDFYKDLNTILAELVDAFNINDSILIGDIMEYEIVPRVNKLLDFVNLIKEIKEDSTAKSDISKKHIDVRSNN